MVATRFFSAFRLASVLRLGVVPERLDGDRSGHREVLVQVVAQLVQRRAAGIPQPHDGQVPGERRNAPGDDSRILNALILTT